MLTSDDLYAEDFEEEAVEDNAGDHGNGDQEEQSQENDEADENKQTVKPKKVVRNPQPKLNEETLKGKRGLTALPSYFERVKFKGKGHEEEDLNVVMKTYEYWCHRLFPKFPFSDCIARIEKLGTKRAVITHVKQIRLDMVQEDKPIRDDSDDDDDDNKELAESLPQFDDLFEPLNIPPEPPVALTDEQEERIRLNAERARSIREEKLRKIREKVDSTLGESSQSRDTQNVKDTSQDLYESELEERIRLNEERARRIREEKLRKIREKAESTLGESSQLQGTQNVEDASQDLFGNVTQCTSGSTQEEIINGQGEQSPILTHDEVLNAGGLETDTEMVNEEGKDIDSILDKISSEGEEQGDEDIDSILNKISTEETDKENQTSVPSEANNL